MLWSPAGTPLLCFLRALRLCFPDAHPSAPTERGEGDFQNLTEGPVLVPVGVLTRLCGPSGGLCA